MTVNMQISPVWDPKFFAVDWHAVGPHRVAHADAIAALGSLENGCLDAIIMDPPYCSGGSSEATRVAAKSQGLSRGQTWFIGDAMTSHEYGFFLERLGQLAVSKLDPQNGSLLVFTDHKMVSVVIRAFSAAGLRLRGLLTWDKMARGRGRGFLPQSEFIVHFTAGATLSAHEHIPNVLQHKRVNHTRRLHPTEKPVGLLTDLLRVVTPKGGLVCDPFCGSGSLGVAAHALGRRAILADWDPKHAQVSATRINTLIKDTPNHA
jgi:site-specific DNA-methyltransferase (adenine-specific)